MAKLRQILGSLMHEITQARAISDRSARELRATYQSDPFLKLLSVPTIEITEVKLDLKLAILKSARDSAINGGMWVIGGRSEQRVVALDARSADGGQSLYGTMVYEGEGPIGFRAIISGPNQYMVENQWGGDAAPWHAGGRWVLGDRAEQRVLALTLNSLDSGRTLNGTVTYSGEGPTEIQGVLLDVNEQTGERLINSYRVTNPRAQNITTNSEDIDVEVVAEQLIALPEAVLSSISITLDMTRV